MHEPKHCFDVEYKIDVPQSRQETLSTLDTDINKHNAANTGACNASEQSGSVLPC